MENPIEVFLSYVSRDKQLATELEKHLHSLARQELITVWHEGHINAGKELVPEIVKHIKAAQIILLLISPDFLTSYYKELEAGQMIPLELNLAIKRQKSGEA